MSESERQWMRVTRDMPLQLRENWWTEINKKYSNSKGREAHNMLHLELKFQELQNFSSILSDVDSFTFALFFQHFEYDTRNPAISDKNLEIFEKFWTEASHTTDELVYKQVKTLLETSLTSCIDEHKTEGLYGAQDVHYFLDLDMAWLGREAETFQQCIEEAVQEYAYLEPAACNKLMQRVLQSFLMIPNIFATKDFRDKYEAKARSNIAEELRRRFS